MTVEPKWRVVGQEVDDDLYTYWVADEKGVPLPNSTTDDYAIAEEWADLANSNG